MSDYFNIYYRKLVAVVKWWPRDYPTPNLLVAISDEGLETDDKFQQGRNLVFGNASMTKQWAAGPLFFHSLRLASGNIMSFSFFNLSLCSHPFANKSLVIGGQIRLPMSELVVCSVPESWLPVA
ncbi:hypothetical protein BB8028_0008g01580 [Beauveria bassiana]|uniref:Uncharacterized protein n=1 Tax=Beauveria bassiana TaxID=176275 RepID=A0A2S7YNW8_BEABA|nr:hypothetical protein BB8028_0008g01580 [Beauveria bassiana]